MKTKKSEEESNTTLLYSVKYSCYSVLGEFSPDQFSKYYFGEIHKIDPDTTQETLIGKVNLKVLLLASAINARL